MYRASPRLSIPAAAHHNGDMMVQLVFAIAVLAALWWVTRWFAAAPAGAVARGLKMAGLAVLVAGGVFLLVTGRLAGLVAVAAGLSPWAMRLLRLHALVLALRRFGVRMGGGRSTAGNTSRVETRFLRMDLDHDTGTLDGEVLEGPFRGRMLSGLSLAQALDLRDLAAADPQSVQVLEAWLDRTHPDWRDQTAPPPPPPSGGAMSRDEALQVLGLQAGATPDEIRAAHRRLMRLAHPDQGGSTWIAARLNQARDMLLGQ